MEHVWDVVFHFMDVGLTNLNQMFNAVMSVWTKTSDDCFQHLVELMLQRIKAVQKANKGESR